MACWTVNVQLRGERVKMAAMLKHASRQKQEMPQCDRHCDSRQSIQTQQKKRAWDRVCGWAGCYGIGKQMEKATAEI